MKTQVLNKLPFEKLDESKGTFLSALEIQNYHELPENKKHDYLSGRYLVKQCFISIIKDEVKMTDFSVSYENSKPQIIYRGKTYRCSISHSKKHVACSIDEWSHAGIDIEEMNARTSEFQEYILSKREAASFHPADSLISTRAWSIKEAAFKADVEQRPLNEYLIIGRDKGLFLVENRRTKQKVRVCNQVVDNYTVSYTMPSAI